MVKKELDISKIVFVGIPLLTMMWGIAFIVLLIISRDMNISKYGSIFILLISIPIYGILVTKYAEPLGATIDSAQQKEDSGANYFRRHLKIYDLVCAGIFGIAAPLYFIIGQVVLNINEERLQSNFKWGILFFICFGIFLRIIFRERIK